ncbi:MAG: UDP-N-acetylglucosamine 1-carboxyvinyltransferase [Patescibacteria group bacterium]|nr:UDP-N-acetylglucosamine 1-carboxyvinyltransferase [Patescibacteria group bacterium]MDE2144381.1 UDP-N-acetylglucosamine 1-carboxyvinyltransferase [Patescibacteria group bacterium]
MPAKAMNFRIEGGNRLSGRISTNSSKNSAVALLQAALLNKNKTVLRDVPRIEEVNRIIEVLRSIGVNIKWINNEQDVEIKVGELHLESIDREAAMMTRSIILLLGPLIHLRPHFKIPQPGGCKLGSRTVRPHLFALENFGVKIRALSDSYEVSAEKLAPADVVLYESGDTATENAIMAASRIEGVTTIKFASANYQIQDLCFSLQSLGVGIEGVGTTTLTITGRKEIDAPAEFFVSEDPIESMMFISIAATTNSSIIIERCPIDFLELELLKLQKMGFRYKILQKYKAKNGFTNLVDIKTFPSRLKALEEKIEARPFPGLNIDNLPFFVPIATQAKGETLIHDWVYENRAIYYTELTKLGADIKLADPHRVFITGVTPLKAAEVVAPPALRPAAIILIAMLAAKGTSTLRNVYTINRGYEDICARLNQLGAKIKIIK